MRQQAKTIGIATLCTLTLLLAGCAGPSSTPSENGSRSTPEASNAGSAPSTAYLPAEMSQAKDWVPPLLASPEEEAAYYVSRLADRRFVGEYGGPDNPRPWYIAAERLGELGLPAVPLLFARLNTDDQYELMLVLYALHLATQDPLVTFQTGGEAVQLPTVLEPSANAENRRIAQQWWERYSAQLEIR
ncbi:hypothetical protein [Vreelandella aquamarina]|uniref:hypothetical protein n=1 Tax=Vreelandella aquamarina TaxID=77097 RepID=UPI00384AA01C